MNKNLSNLTGLVWKAVAFIYFVNMYILKRPSCIKILLIIKQRKKIMNRSKLRNKFLGKGMDERRKRYEATKSLCITTKKKTYH